MNKEYRVSNEKTCLAVAPVATGRSTIPQSMAKPVSNIFDKFTLILKNKANSAMARIDVSSFMTSKCKVFQARVGQKNKANPSIPMYIGTQDKFESED